MALVSDPRADLRRVIPDEQRVNDGDSVLEQHAADLSYHPPRRPDVVVFPESESSSTSRSSTATCCRSCAA